MCPVRTGGGFDWFQFDSGSITEALTKLESLPLKSSFAHPCFYSVGLYIILVYNQKRPWCWEILKAGGKGDDRGWDSWMASLTPWTWVWASSRSWWWTGRPGMLQSLGSQRVGHDWTTELNQNVTNNNCFAHIRAATELWGCDTGEAVCRKFEERASFLGM